MVTRNANEAMAGSGGVCVWREPGVRCRLYVCVFGREVVSAFNLLYKEKFEFVVSELFAKIMLQ